MSQLIGLFRQTPTLRARLVALGVLAVALLAGCSAQADGGLARVEYLKNGAPVHIYPRLQAEPGRLPTDLRVGADDGAQEYMFGDVRGVDVDADENIYVLDSQAMEVRVFDKDGRYLQTIAARGQGPGEITRANGIQIGADTTLWIQDHGRYAMTAVALDGGGELATAPMPVRSYGYVWNGGVDGAGRIWKVMSRSPDPAVLAGPPESGPLSGEVINSVVRYDPTSSVQDTLELTTSRTLSYVMRMSNGWRMYSVPYTPRWMAAATPSGDLWHGQSSSYRLARVSPAGDTLLVLEVEIDRDPVTEEDRRDVIDRVLEQGDVGAAVSAELGALIPDEKTVLLGLWVDKEGRLWVRPGTDAEAPPRFDVFESDGDYLGSVQLDEVTSPYHNPSLRFGRVYGISTDSLGAPIVFRTVPMDI